MKKVLFGLILLFCFSLSAEYQVGEVVTDFNFTDQDGEKSIYSLVDDKKVVVLFFGGRG